MRSPQDATGSPRKVTSLAGARQTQDIRGLPALIPHSTASLLNRVRNTYPSKCSGKPTQGYEPCRPASNTRYASREQPTRKAGKTPAQPVHERKQKERERKQRKRSLGVAETHLLTTLCRGECSSQTWEQFERHLQFSTVRERGCGPAVGVSEGGVKATTGEAGGDGAGGGAAGNVAIAPTSAAAVAAVPAKEVGARGGGASC